MTRATNVPLPDLGDFSEVPVITILVQPGDRVEAEQPLIELESDKATMEVPAPFAGIVETITVSVGDTVSQGDLLLSVVAEGAVGDEPAVDTVPTPQPDEAPKPEAPVPSPQTQTLMPSQSMPTSSEHIFAGPSVRKYARELGVDLSQVVGTGSKNRISREDVQAHVKAAASMPAATSPQSSSTTSLAVNHPAWPEPNYADFGPIEEFDLSRIQTISAGNLSRNWVTIPHVTNFDKSDITETEAFRKSINERDMARGAKVTMLALMMKASVAALKEFPRFNVSFAGGKLIQKKYYHIGFAADTPKGLVVPVVRDCDRKGIAEIATEMGALAAKARDGKLTGADMSGGCFTVSSLGGIGGTGFTPIINAPEVAILGATRSEIQPVWNGESFEPRLIQPLSLSWDHRAVDGAAAARFLKHLAAGLSDTRQLLL